MGGTLFFLGGTLLKHLGKAISGLSASPAADPRLIIKL
jgi:hypothetical protein